MKPCPAGVIGSPQDQIYSSLCCEEVGGLSSVQFSHSVMSDSLRPHESQHTSLPVHHQLPEFTETHVH